MAPASEGHVGEGVPRVLFARRSKTIRVEALRVRKTLRVAVRERAVAAAQAIHHARAEVLDHDVALCRELADHGDHAAQLLGQR